MKILLFFLALIFSGLAFSQEPEYFIFDPAKKYTQEFVDSVVKNYEAPMKTSELKKVLESNPNLLGWTRYYSSMASLAIRANKIDSSLYYVDKSIEAYENAEIKRPIDEENLILSYNLKGYSLRILKDYNNSIVNYQKALDLIKKYPYKWKSFIQVGIAGNHFALGNDSLSLKYYLDVSKDTLYMGIPRSSITTYTSIGALYEKSQDYLKAEQNYEKALKISDTTDYKTSTALINGLLGGLFNKQDKPDEALAYYRAALKADEQYGIGNFDGAADNNKFYKSYIKVHDGPLEEGISEIKELIKTVEAFDTKNWGNKELMLKSLNLLGLAYQKQGNAKEYQNLISKTSQFLDIFHEGQLKEDLQNLETQYQTKVKDASIVQLEESKVQQELIIKQQRAIAFGLGGLLLLLSLLGVLFWRQHRFRNQYEKVNLEQRLLRSQMNPHFIFNALNVISGLANKKSGKTNAYILKFSSLLRLILNNSREEFVLLQDEVTALEDYLTLQSDFNKKFEYNLQIDKSLDKNEMYIPPMLIQPFVENSIEHGIRKITEGKINIYFSSVSDKQLIECVIEDNGIGFSEGKEKNHAAKGFSKSVSTEIVNERLEIYRKKFKVDAKLIIADVSGDKSNKSRGTKVILSIPYLSD